jgi:RND family efflux transporter MFP subunit
MKKNVGILMGLVLVALVGVRLYQKTAGKASQLVRADARAAVAVVLAPVRTEGIRDTRVFTGTVLPREQFAVAPKLPGRLDKLFVNIGAVVTNGQLIAVLDDEEYRQQVEQTQAELEVARAAVLETSSALEVAQRQLDRANELIDKRVTSEAELDQVDARHKAAKVRHAVTMAVIRQKEAALRVEDARLAYTQISVAWADGADARVVGERFVDEGAMLKANEPVVSILDVATVLVTMFVIERDYPQVLIGQQATVSTDAFPDRTFAGTVMRKAPLLKESSRQARVEIEVANPGRLLAPGMFVRAELQFAAHAAATVVPVAALARREGRSGVFLADTAALTVRFVPVTAGIVSGERVEIIAPSLTGLVVVLGQHLLEDGAAIMLPATNTPPAARR